MLTDEPGTDLFTPTREKSGAKRALESTSSTPSPSQIQAQKKRKKRRKKMNQVSSACSL